MQVWVHGQCFFVNLNQQVNDEIISKMHEVYTLNICFIFYISKRTEKKKWPVAKV